MSANITEGSVVRGTVELGGVSGDDLVLVWPGSDAGPGRATASAPKQVVDDRLQEIGRRLERLVARVRVRPEIPAHELLEELGEILGRALQNG
jgi:hypothetical protein